MPSGQRSSDAQQALYVPAVEVTRGSMVESIHAAAIAVVDADGALRASLGGTDHPVFMRSAVKPLQAMAVIESGALERFGLGLEELAVMCGSHGSERSHVAAVGRILEKCGLEASALRCGTHTPFNRDVADAYRRSGRAPGPIDHNCSGKHAGMLAAALAGGHDPASYTAPDHPVQRRVLECVADMTGRAQDRILTATDGCGVPALGIGLADAARAFARLAGAGAGAGGAVGEHADAARRVVAAMRAHPDMVAGTGMSDTWITARPHHGLIAKRGAEGVQCLGFVKDGVAIGVAAKIADGNNMRARIALVREILRQMEILDDDFESLDDAANLVIRNDAGRQVGEVRAAFTLRRA